MDDPALAVDHRCSVRDALLDRHLAPADERLRDTQRTDERLEDCPSFPAPVSMDRRVGASTATNASVSPVSQASMNRRATSSRSARETSKRLLPSSMCACARARICREFAADLSTMRATSSCG